MLNRKKTLEQLNEFVTTMLRSDVQSTHQDALNNFVLAHQLSTEQQILIEKLAKQQKNLKRAYRELNNAHIGSLRQIESYINTFNNYRESEKRLRLENETLRERTIKTIVATNLPIEAADKAQAITNTKEFDIKPLPQWENVNPHKELEQRVSDLERALSNLSTQCLPFFRIG